MKIEKDNTKNASLVHCKHENKWPKRHEDTSRVEIWPMKVARPGLKNTLYACVEIMALSWQWVKGLISGSKSLGMVVCQDSYQRFTFDDGCHDQYHHYQITIRSLSDHYQITIRSLSSLLSWLSSSLLIIVVAVVVFIFTTITTGVADQNPSVPIRGL